MTCNLQGKLTHCASVRSSVILIALIAIFAGVTVSPAAAGTNAVADTTLMRQLASELNLVRRDAGLPGLRYSQGLALAAAARAEALAAQGWADKPLAGTALRRKVSSYYGQGATSWRVGETVLWADGKICGSAVVYFWLDKLRDKTTVMSSRWAEAGIAAVRSGGDTFVVVEFGART
jgi:uncharacterized protein YkwD